jgi:hypothetical protein
MASWDFLVKRQLELYGFVNLDVYPTPPRPTRATRDAGSEHLWCISGRISRSTKSGSRRKGTVEDGTGVGSDRAVGDGALSALILVDPMCRPWLTGMGDTDVTRVVSYLKVDEILLT